MTNPNKVTLKEKIGYGLGDAASSMFWKLFGMYLMIFYTDVFGIPAAVVGTMFLVTRIWDSIIDPLVGVAADRTRTRWGRFRPYILFLAVPFGIIGVLTFTTPDLGMTGKIIYAYATYSLMMMFYSMINVPYASLLGVMTDQTNTRTELSSYRMIFAFAGSILVLVLVDPLVRFFGRTGGETAGWHYASMVFAAIAIVFFLCTFFWTRERVKPIREEKNSFGEDIGDLFRNRPWWILFVAGVGALVFNSIRDGAAAYYFKYYVEYSGGEINIFKTSMSLTTIYLVLGQAANILGIIIAVPVSRRIGKKLTFFGAMSLSALLSVLFYFIGKGDILTMMSMQILISMCAGAIFPLLWSMYADTADWSELTTGRRATGLIFSSSSMSQKLGWTLGGALTGWLLGFYGFKANVAQGESALHGIRMMLSLLPAAGAALGAVFISMYPLSENKLHEIRDKLKAMRHEQL
ncbi:MFS transporter [Bacteroidia bacterium]|nr:MFS transporter [Bacteroidia bacterium]